MTNLSDIARLQSNLKSIAAMLKRRDSLSGKDYSDMTPKAAQKNGADLSWLGMDIDKAMREAHAAAVDIGIADMRAGYGPVDYHPSGFHHYRHTPTLPRGAIGGAA